MIPPSFHAYVRVVVVQTEVSSLKRFDVFQTVSLGYNDCYWRHYRSLIGKSYKLRARSIELILE